jgi:hypothetical protein
MHKWFPLVRLASNTIGEPFVDRHDRAVVLLDLLFTQSQVSHKGHIEVALNHPGVKVSEIGEQAKEDT